MKFKNIFYIFLMTLSVSTMYSMNNVMDNVATKTIGAGMFAGGMGLVIVGVHNNKDFIKNRKTQYLDKEKTTVKTLYCDEWIKEVLLPVSGGAIMMLSGLLMITSGFDV